MRARDDMNARVLAMFDEATQRKNGVNQHSEGVDNVNTLGRPDGNSAQTALRRLRKDRPDLLEKRSAIFLDFDGVIGPVWPTETAAGSAAGSVQAETDSGSQRQTKAIHSR